MNIILNLVSPDIEVLHDTLWAWSYVSNFAWYTIIPFSFFEKNRLTFKCFSDTDDSPLLQFPHLITTLIGLIAARGGVEDVKSFVCNVFKNELF